MSIFIQKAKIFLFIYSFQTKGIKQTIKDILYLDTSVDHYRILGEQVLYSYNLIAMFVKNKQWFKRILIFAVLNASD